MKELPGPPIDREPVVFREEQAIRHLSREVWERSGNNLVSRHSFTPDAVAQIEGPLTEATRDALKFRTEPSNDGSKRLVLQARAAERFFAEQGLAANIEAEQSARLR
jgi:hypothetical protein